MYKNKLPPDPLSKTKVYRKADCSEQKFETFLSLYRKLLSNWSYASLSFIMLALKSFWWGTNVQFLVEHRNIIFLAFFILLELWLENFKEIFFQSE